MTGREATVRRLLPLILVAAAIVYPVADSSSSAMARGILALVLLIAAMCLNFAFGYGGMLAVGQPAMMTIAGYTAGLLSKHAGLDWWWTVPCAVVASVLVSILMGLPSLRVRGWYLGVVSFVGVAIVPDLLESLRAVTGDTEGIAGIRPIGFGPGKAAPPWVVYELVLVVTVAVAIAIRNLVTSGWGTTLVAYRDHPVAAVAAGVDQLRLRAAVYVLSGIPVGIAGALYAHSLQYISPTNFSLHTVFLLIGSVFLGGPGTLWGPFVGVVVFQGLSLFVGQFSPLNPLVLGLGVLASALLFRDGITQTASKAWRRLTKAKKGQVRLRSMADFEHAIPPVGPPPILEVSDLHKRFGGNVVLSGVSMTVTGGAVTTVVGANGSGKTTLLNCINGFVTRDSGGVVIDGRALDRLAVHERAQLGLGRTFQIPRLIDSFTVLQNVELGVYGLRPPGILQALFRLPGFSGQQRIARDKALRACAALGFGDEEAQIKVGELPLGLKRLVEIARTIAADARVICLDEPVAGLNDAERAQAAAVFRALAASGRAVLLIEHNLPFVHAVSDQILLLDKGGVADVGEPEATQDAGRLLGAYFQTFTARA